MRHLADGLLDIAVLYSPEARPGFLIEKLMDETLVMIASRPGHNGPGAADYVFVDWGPDFDAWHSDQFPQYHGAGLNVSLGALGFRHVLTNGGAGYFPARVVAPEIAAHRLFPIIGAPQFLRPFHVIYPAGGLSESTMDALASLREATRDEARMS